MKIYNNNRIVIDKIGYNESLYDIKDNCQQNDDFLKKGNLNQINIVSKLFENESSLFCIYRRIDDK